MLRIERSSAETTEVSVQRLERTRLRIVPGGTARLGELIEPICLELGAPSVHVLIDETVSRIHGDRLVASLTGKLPRVHTVSLPSGEASKSETTLLRTWHQLHEQGASRRSVLVAVGGGVVCDLVSLVASTYMRGLPYINVPTTLLAQVDAAIGGKGGIDFAGVKNLIGAFRHPESIIVDPDVLETLPATMMSAGAAEIIKVALIDDADLYDLLTLRGRDCLRPNSALLVQVIARAISGKLRLLADDPFEQASLDRLLNLGHCFGHPIEAASGYAMSHGESVACGLALAAVVSYRRGLATEQSCVSVLRALTLFDLPLEMPLAVRPHVWSHLDEIRRIRNGRLRLVLPVEPGNCVIVEGFDELELDNSVETLGKLVHDHARDRWHTWN